MAMRPEIMMKSDGATGKLQCLACAHHCRLGEGQAGICGVRHVVNGELKVQWGEVSGLALDPMEKKPLYHFLPAEPVLSFGTLGCNFSCAFCQNWHSSQVGKDPQARARTEPCSAEYIIAQAKKHQVRALASTYNEPLVSIEWTSHLLALAKAEGIHGCLISNGFFSEEALALLTPLTSAVNIDLKCFSDDGYRSLGGRLAPVLAGIRALHAAGVWIELTTLVVPGFNDSDAELRQIADFIAGVSPDIPWHVSSYFSTYKMPAEPARTPPGRIAAAVEQGRQAGLRFVYTGNDCGGVRQEDTHCPQCAQLLIARRGFQVRQKQLDKGRCPRCGHPLPGVFT
ncbi:MAG: AmmeMemoRadiSam system radical SAM enzyme [Lentisphaeria bacterium]